VRVRFISYAAFIALAWPRALAAAEELPPPPDLITTSIKMAGALALLIGGLLLAMYVLRRFGKIKGQPLGGGGLIRIIATRALAPKQYIAVVKVGDSVLTLGVTEQAIACLDKTDADAFREQSPETAGPAAGSFARAFRSLAGRTESSEAERP
jgi:flagellar biosynthetic protein FliO